MERVEIAEKTCAKYDMCFGQGHGVIEVVADVYFVEAAAGMHGYSRERGNDEV